MDNNNIESDNRRLGGIFLMIGWLIALILVALLIHQIMYSTKPPTINDTYAGTTITVYRDYDSHFRIIGNINGIPVKFLIDTGATSIAVTESIAKKTNLAKKSRISTETANGEAVGYMTKINDLSLGKIELHNLSAVIIPDMGSDEALLGMNVLSKFIIQQDEDSLTLTVGPAAEAGKN